MCNPYHKIWAPMVAVPMLIGLLAGCASFPENPPLTKPLGQGYRYSTLDAASDQDAWSRETLVFLTFSGGGTRAAAFAYGALQQLRETCIQADGKKRALLDEVDIISSNSGGSYAAAYYGLFRDAAFKQPAAVDCGAITPVPQAGPVQNFVDRFLRRSFQSELKRTLLNPASLIKIASAEYNRTDRAAEIVDEIMYHKTFADLQKRGKPLIVINAHDTSFASRFSFTQEQFDLMCADLSAMPVARAVMASSAVHGLFAGVRLVNYGGTCWPGTEGGSPRNQLPKELAIQAALSPVTKQANLPRYLEGRRQQAYRYGLCWPYKGAERAQCLADRPKRLTVHLNDGGAVDNLGLDTVNSYLGNDLQELNAFQQLQKDEVRRIIVLVVNASNVHRIDQIEDRGDGSGINNIAQAINATIDAKSLASVSSLNVHLEFWKKFIESNGRGKIDLLPPILAQAEVLEGAEVNAAGIRNVQCLGESLGTNFELSDAQVDAAIHAGRKAMADAGGMSQLLQHFNGTAPVVKAKDYCTLPGIK
jgi:NTE family protein